MSPETPPPIVRQDLSLGPAEPDADGSPAWIVHDDLSGRYFRLAQVQMELLRYIDGREAAEIVAQARSDLRHDIDEADVEEMFEFLRRHNLVVPDAAQQHWLRWQRSQSKGVLAHMASTYLSFRIPLWRPDRFLSRALPWVAWLGKPVPIQSIVLLGLIGLFLALRQFDNFLSTFLYFFNLQGMIYFGLALIGVKALHELGHGFVAKAFGCRVPVMGVAFIVLWPVLYTDTSDAWRVASRSKRLRIDAAGMAVELSIAALALLVWSVVPDGPIRSVLFILATSTWLVSLAVNLNPLMRFDGYYLLVDYWRAPNLEPRSHAMARWWLREKLFGINAEPPEPYQRRFVIFAIAVWIYRFLLFLGIALLVYHLAFKLLGAILFLLEIGYFIVLPVLREMRQWIDRRSELRWNLPVFRSLLILLCALALFLVPWRSQVSIPAILQAQYQSIYAPADAQLQQIVVRSGQSVLEGETLAVFASPELSYDLSQAELRLAELQWQREALGIDRLSLDRALVTRSEVESQHRRLNSLKAESDQLVVAAAMPGMIVDVDSTLDAGAWVAEGSRLMALVNNSEIEVVAYPGENLLGVLQEGSSGYFYPAGGGRSKIQVRVEEIDYFGLRVLEQPYSASLFGGSVAVRENANGELLPVDATYRVRLVPASPLKSDRVLRGNVVLDAPVKSYADRVWRWIISGLTRESGF
ncbi:MAG: hypothetical protein RKH07_01315 [Gammaproteobacteria bacterium]